MDAKEDFAVYFKGETEVCENLTYKPDEDYWFWDKRGCDMIELALAEWPDDYTVKSVAEAFSVDVPGLVQNGNVFGAQFHPEKSGPVGLNILRAFGEGGAC